MAAILQIDVHQVHGISVVGSLFGEEILLDDASVLGGLKGLVESYIADAGFVGRTSGHAVEVVDGEAELGIVVGGHVGRTCRFVFQNSCNSEGFLYTGNATIFVIIAVIINYHDRFTIASGVVVVHVGIEVGQRCEGEIYHLAVTPQVDAVFAVVEGDGRRTAIQRLMGESGKGHTIEIGVRHTWLHAVHQVGECHIVVKAARLVSSIHRSRAELVLQLVYSCTSLRHLERAAWQYHLLEVGHRDVRHRRHILVEADSYRAVLLSATVHRYLFHGEGRLVVSRVTSRRRYHWIVDNVSTRCQHHGDSEHRLEKIRMFLFHCIFS